MPSLKVPVTAEDHIQGNENALVTLVEYGDYECPHCGHAHTIVKQLQRQFGSKLRFVFRNFPLTEIHPLAEPAAETAEYADSLGLFWEMHDLIFENQANLSSGLLIELAESLGLSEGKLEKILLNHTYEPKIQKDFLGGVKSGVNGTPTFFINNERHRGSFEFEELAAAIQQFTQKIRA